MRKLLIGVLVVVLLLVVAVVALPFLLPRDMIKAQVEQRVSEQLGRDFRIEGPLELRPWRPFALSLADVRLANPGWAQNPDLARIASVELDVDALAYLGGTVAIERLAITQPVLALEVREDGTPSWQFATPPDSTGDSSGDGPGDGAGDGAGDGIPELRIGEIRITEGVVSFDDRSSGEAREFAAIELWARGEPDGDGLNVDGSITSAGERATLTGAVGDLNGLLAGEPSSLNLEVAAPGLGIAANGEAAANGAAVLAVSGDMAPRQLLDWLGQPLDLPDGTFETVTFTADIASAASGVAVPALTLNVDDLTIKGNLELATAELPRLTGRLDLGDLDLRPYLPAAGGGTEAAPQEAAAETGSAEPAGWPQAPLDLPLPLPLDLDLRLVFAGVETGKLSLGNGTVAISADQEETAVEITELALYGGTAVGRVALTNGDAVGLDATADVQAIQLEPLLVAVADFDKLAGSGTVKITVQSQGASIAALMQAMNGEGEVRARDGAVLGVNIGAAVRQVLTLGVAGREDAPLRTDFAEAGGTFRITNGVLANEDFALRAPVLRVEGGGTVDLAAQTLDYRLLPRVAGTLEGQDASGDAAFQAGLPIVISGAWADPAIRLDLGGTLSGDVGDPAALAETLATIAADPARLEDLQDTLNIDPGSAIGNLLEGVLGGQPSGDGEPVNDPAGQLLEGLGNLLQR